ncbi:MAG TPA: TonB family protein [Candidatus Binataceae bacterium]|nr:TonB family protein [Candidatus Binataceae bacterium]
MKLAAQVKTVSMEETPSMEWFERESPLKPISIRRFAVATACAIAACLAMTGGFAEILISERPLAPPRTSAIVAQLIDVTPPPPPAAPIPMAPELHPHIAKPTLAHRAVPKPPPAAAPVVAKPFGPPVTSDTGIAVGNIDSLSKTPSEKGSTQGEGEGGGGSETSGASALYSPIPKIPDDLREDAFSAVAVAHFIVDKDGNVQVTLSKPTNNPALNQIILDTLRKWKFFPAVKDGTPVASEFDVRIPIAVQ